MDVAVEFSWNTLSVSTSLLMMWYFLMIPLWCSAGGGDQESRSVVESSDTTDTSLGTCDGAGG